MKSNKLLRYSMITGVVFILFAVIGKNAGWFGKEDVVSVSVEKVELRTITETITANGKIQPVTEVRISPDVSGEIIELHVKEGDKVERGKLLLRIKPDTYISMRDRAEAAVNTSKANLANARARQSQVEAQLAQTELSFDRTRRLYEQQTISQSEYESALATYNMHKAELEAAKQNVVAGEFGVRSAEASLKEANEYLTKTFVYAPMSGTVSMLNVETGERVVGTEMMTGTEMLRIADLSFMEVVVDVNENNIVRVGKNDTAIVEVDAYLGEKFRGVVTEIANSANVAGMTTDQVTNFEVKILMLKESYNHVAVRDGQIPFRPGMSATVEIRTETRHEVLSVPIQAVTTRLDSVLIAELGTDSLDQTGKYDEIQEIVFVAENNQAKVKAIKTGLQDNNFIEVISGLKEDDLVITAPYTAITRRLKHNSAIEITDKNELYK